MPTLHVPIQADYERFRGALFGHAVGDMLGKPVEFLSPQQIENQYGKITDITGGGHLQWEPHEWTDDTEMMLLTAESLIDNDKFDPADMAQRYVAWAHSKPKDIGIATASVLNDIAAKKPWQQAALDYLQNNPNRASGNGSLMRIIPIGLFNYHNAHLLKRQSMVNSSITHAAEECQLACYVFNKTVGELVQGHMPPADSVRQEAYALIDGLRTSRQTSHGYVTDTLKMALDVYDASGFEETIIDIVNRGYDADTNAAVAGGLLGAKLGYDAIPKRWVTAMKPQQRARIEHAARGLYDLSQNHQKVADNHH